MLKKVTFIILLIVNLICNAQPGPSHHYRKEMFTLEKEVLIYPDSLQLHYKLFELYTYVSTKQNALKKINFLLSKKPNNIEYQKSKFEAYLNYPYIESDVEKAYQFYLKNLTTKLGNCQNKKKLKKIAQGYETADVYNKAFLFYDKALNVPKCEDENSHILERKEALYHKLKDYKNSYKISRERKGLSIYNTEYCTIYLKDYKKSINDLYILLEQQDGVVKKDNKYYIEGLSLKSIHERILKQLAYNYYKIGNLEKSLILLNILTEKHFGSDLGENYRYWCMFLDLYDLYKNVDFRVHLLLAHRYISGANYLRSPAYFKEIPQLQCDPHDDLKIPYMSNDKEEKFIINLGIKEIEVAEKLTNQKFDLYRVSALMKMKKMKNAKNILDMLIKKNPDDFKTLSKIRYYYFLKELYLDIFDNSKISLKRKAKYKKLHDQYLYKCLKISKQSKAKLIILEDD